MLRTWAWVPIAIFLYASPTNAADALDKMEKVFVGGHSRERIERELIPVMKAYGAPLTEDGYSRAGSVLVTMRKESSVPEISILRCMQAAAKNGAYGRFDQMAAICTTTLENQR